jgi:hypothetical protein
MLAAIGLGVGERKNKCEDIGVREGGRDVKKIRSAASRPLLAAPQQPASRSILSSPATSEVEHDHQHQPRTPASIGRRGPCVFSYSLARWTMVGGHPRSGPQS